jgi:hypothetical protein
MSMTKGTTKAQSSLEAQVAQADRLLQQEVARLRRAGGWQGRPLQLGGTCPAGLSELAQLILRELGFECSDSDDLPPGYDELTRPFDGTVSVRSSLSLKRRAHAWVHEMGHGLLQHGQTGHTKDSCDIEAEHYTFLVLQVAGLGGRCEIAPL